MSSPKIITKGVFSLEHNVHRFTSSIFAMKKHISRYRGIFADGEQESQHLVLLSPHSFLLSLFNTQISVNDAQTNVCSTPLHLYSVQQWNNLGELFQRRCLPIFIVKGEMGEQELMGMLQVKSRCYVFLKNHPPYAQKIYFTRVIRIFFDVQLVQFVV